MDGTKIGPGLARDVRFRQNDGSGEDHAYELAPKRFAESGSNGRRPRRVAP